MPQAGVRISLVGLPGAGKSSVARQLARQLGWRSTDTDARIEARLGEPIKHFFARAGEEAFRALESEVLVECLREPGPIVLATGGGIVLSEANRERLHAQTKVFYLRTHFEELARRLRNDTHRPLLQGVDARSKLRDLYLQRDPLYRRTAHYVVECHRPSVPALVHWVQMQIELGGHGRAQPEAAQAAPTLSA